MMHTRLLSGMAVLAALAPGASIGAAPDPMAGYYGNTLTVAVPAAYYYSRRFIDPDGTWSETRGAGVSARGKWYVQGEEVCSVQTEPKLQNPRVYCYPRAAAHVVGDEWSTTDPDTGNKVLQALEPGRRPVE